MYRNLSSHAKIILIQADYDRKGDPRSKKILYVINDNYIE
jgi:hypothetical protein